jgi:hypothetical protein
MKRFLLGTVFGVLATIATLYSMAWATGVHFNVDLTAHDAAGRTLHATAIGNSYSYIGLTMYTDFTSDQILCSGFGQ